MKTITSRDYELINDILSEGLSQLSPGIIEKDLLVTEALHAVVTTLNSDVIPIFCGGTCLAKAHGLIDRMSEDIDFKLVVADGLSRSGRSRLLSAFKKQLSAAFEEAGFSVPAERVIARNENSYISLSLHYESRFAPVASLRPEIKVELNARAPMLPTVSLPIGSMLDALRGSSAAVVTAECVSYDETLSEKVLSFLRRTAEARAGRNRGEYDDRLVRHLYDVKSILHAHPGLEMPISHFVTIAEGDAFQYRNQFPEFYSDPLGQMRGVLVEISKRPASFERSYQQFVNELVFGDSVSFAEARSAFFEAADKLLSGMEATRERQTRPN